MTRSVDHQSAFNLPSIAGGVEHVVESFHERMARNPEWAMSEASNFFDERGAVQQALKRITTRLNELGIDYAVVGGMALFKYGFRRFTEDVDLLVTKEGLREIHQKLDGLGYVPPFEQSKNLRDTEFGVKIEFLLSGGFPGDGKPKAVSFPNPKDVAVEQDGIRYVNLPTLVELKIASGISSSDRLKDLSDVVELIKELNLPKNFSDSLNLYVRGKFVELWNSARPASKRFALIWRNKWLTSEAKSLEEMITLLQSAASELQEMLDDGVALSMGGGTADDYAYLVTSDPEIAKKYGMHDESEFWEDDEDEVDENNDASS